MAYNGWANYETWYFKLFLSEYIGDNHLMWVAKEILDDVNADEDIDSEIIRNGTAVVRMRDELTDIIDDIESDNYIDSALISALYDAAKQRIDIEEIAQWYLDACEEYVKNDTERSQV